MSGAAAKQGKGSMEGVKEDDTTQIVVADLPFWEVHWWKFILW